MIPAILFHFSVSASSRFRPRRRQPIILRTPVVFAVTPLACNRSLMLKPVERGIERALLDHQFFARNLLDAQQHPVPMERPKGNGLEDQHVECAQKAGRGICQGRIWS